MSAFARSQTRLPERVALAASVPVVFQLPSMVSPLTITSRVVPPSRLTPIQAEESRSSASPARSPWRIAVWSGWTVAVEVGPWMRWVRVLRAQYRSLVTVAVRRVGPLSTDHLVLSGLWFHSHRGLRVVPSKVSTPIIGVTWRGGVGTAGLGYEVPHAPFTSCRTGRPSGAQVTGAGAGIRPPGYASTKAMQYQAPLCEHLLRAHLFAAVG